MTEKPSNEEIEVVIGQLRLQKRESLDPDYLRFIDRTVALIEALTAWNTRPSVVPEGYKLVPVEPTEAMLTAFHMTVEASALQDPLGYYGEAYAALLSASTGEG